MFYVTYTLNELRRRSGRTVLTALGLAIGVGLVVASSRVRSAACARRAFVLPTPSGTSTRRDGR